MPVARSIIWPLGDPEEEAPEYASVFACVCARAWRVPTRFPFQVTLS